MSIKCSSSNVFEKKKNRSFVWLAIKKRKEKKIRLSFSLYVFDCGTKNRIMENYYYYFFVKKKNEMIENVICINLLSCHYYIKKKINSL